MVDEDGLGNIVTDCTGLLTASLLDELAMLFALELSQTFESKNEFLGPFNANNFLILFFCIFGPAGN